VADAGGELEIGHAGRPGPIMSGFDFRAAGRHDRADVGDNKKGGVALTSRE
jgi:hypothetical protein